jgi:hypothetical protein
MLNNLNLAHLNRVFSLELLPWLEGTLKKIQDFYHGTSVGGWFTQGLKVILLYCLVIKMNKQHLVLHPVEAHNETRLWMKGN